MFVIIGYVVVFGSVVLGYTMHGGQLGVLWQVTEFIIIGGAGLGTLIVSSPVPLIKDIIKQLLGTLKHKDVTKETYIEVLVCLYEVFKTAKGNLLGLEAHVENPEASEIFKKYPHLLHNHHAMRFICDTLKVQISSPVSPFDLEELMEKDIEAAHTQEHQAPAAVTTVGDAMPGLGIVAAVLGVVITMGKLTEGKEVIGHSVAAALVGTFIGILLSYGMFGPIAKKMESIIAEEGKVVEVIKAGILAFAKDASPKVCVEFARRAIPPGVRPDFNEVDKATANLKK
jgi:chemotaxis protein MotA